MELVGDDVREGASQEDRMVLSNSSQQVCNQKEYDNGGLLWCR